MKATSQRVGATANPFHDAEKLHTIEDTLTCSWAISSETYRATRNDRQVSPLRKKKNKKIKASSVLNCFLFSEINKKNEEKREKRLCAIQRARIHTHTHTYAVYTSVA